MLSPNSRIQKLVSDYACRWIQAESRRNPGIVVSCERMQEAIRDWIEHIKKIKRPYSHPGDIIRGSYMRDFSEMSVQTFADMHGLDRAMVKNLLSGKISVTPQIARKLARAFSTSEDLWLNMQANHDAVQVLLNSSNVY